jgi:preprotein translocase subunit YajC
MDPNQTGNIFSLLLPFIIMIGAMYLLIFMPQKKREKKTREMIDALTTGENIITIGGIAGKVINIKDDELTVETGVEKTRVVIKKWAVKEVEKPLEA